MALAAVATLGLVALVVTSTGDDAANPVDAEPEPSAGRPAEVGEPGRATEPLVGPGPDLEWEPLSWRMDTPEFRWMSGAFVGDDGATEWRVRPAGVGLFVTQRQSVLVDFPDYYIVDAEGQRVLAPRVDQPDHLLFVEEDREVVRVEIPTREPVTDLVVRRARIDVAVIDDRAVVVIERVDAIDPRTLGPRIGWDLVGRQPTVQALGDELRIRVSDPGEEAVNGIITVPIAATDLTVTELEALQPGPAQIDVVAVDLSTATTGPPGIVPDVFADVGVAGNRFVLEWSTADYRRHVSTSPDGRTWRPQATGVGVVGVVGDDIAIAGIEQTTSDIARSFDGGMSWQFTPAPMPKFELTMVDDVVAIRSLASGQDGLAVGTDYPIDLGKYELVITGAGRSFELRDPETEALVTEGVIEDSATGAAYDPFGAGLAVIDPENGEELTVSQAQLWLAFTTTDVDSAPAQTIGLAQWDPSGAPVWRVEPIDAVFGPDAVRINLVGGDEHMLAVVTTANGFDFYIAEIP